MLNSALVIDDDQVSNFLTGKILTKTGIFKEVHVAVNGQKAIEFIENCCLTGCKFPDVILVDLQMPVMSGFEFLGAIKDKYYEQYAHAAICILTTSDHVLDKQTAEQLGIYYYINKPLTEEKLFQVLKHSFPRHIFDRN